MKEVILSLMVWIGANTDYKVSVPPPIVEVQTQEQLVERMGETAIPRTARLDGLYDPQTKRLYLDDTVDINTDEGKSTLLHELVHHYQFMTKKKRTNPCLYEAEAYSIEDKWRREHGLVVSVANPGFIFWMGQCVLRVEYVP